MHHGSIFSAVTLSTHILLFPIVSHCRSELKEPVGQIVCTDKGILAVEQSKVLVPPSWSKTFAWGYADLSCRLANYESDKVSCLIPMLVTIMLCSLNTTRRQHGSAGRSAFL